MKATSFEYKPVISGDFLKTIAHSPGVYLMKDKAGQPLYVGKAKDLRKRLASYARYETTQYSKTAIMLSKVRQIETIITQTEKEALILEASLIKKHMPKYNVILRDDKNYPLIKVTVKETWPRIIMTRRRVNDGSRYFGPFSSSSAMWDTLNYLNSLFPLRRCKGKELRKRVRPCLNHQMRRCLAPCAGKVNNKVYQELVHNVLMILEGRNRQLIDELNKKMKKASEELRFEEAAVCRDRIKALHKTLEKQVMVAGHSRNQDVFGFYRQSASVAISIIFVRRGAVCGQQPFFLAEPLDNDAEVLAEALARYYSNKHAVPQEIILPFSLEGMDTLKEWLADLREGKVDIRVPKRGDLLNLLKMAETNAREIFADREKKAESWHGLAAALQKKLQLSHLPERIECLDISNISGEQAVGALVSFAGGEKETGKYRHYKIRTRTGPDDYGMMAEALTRRLRKGKEHGDLPALLMVDGGKGQLNVAVAVVNDLELQDDVDLVGIAKEKEGEGEKIYRPGRKNPILLANHSPVLHFLMRIRDESHRYGISFHRRWRQKKTLQSSLDTIRGVGLGRRKMLLKTLGSLKRIQNASVGELADVPGIGQELAGQIWTHFHGDR